MKQLKHVYKSFLNICIGNTGFNYHLRIWLKWERESRNLQWCIFYWTPLYANAEVKRRLIGRRAEHFRWAFSGVCGPVSETGAEAEAAGRGSHQIASQAYGRQIYLGTHRLHCKAEHTHTHIRSFAAPAASFLWANTVKLWRYCCNLHKHCVNIGTSRACTHTLQSACTYFMCVCACVMHLTKKYHWSAASARVVASSSSSLNNSRRSKQRERKRVGMSQCKSK